MISDDRLAEVWRAYENNGQNELEQWIKDTHDDELAALIEGFPKDKTTFVVDWQHLWRFSPDESPFENQKLAEVVISKHHDIRKLFEWVVEDAVESIGHSLNFEDNEFQVRFNRVRQPKDVTKTIKGDDVNELSTIRGQVSKASATKPRVTEAALVCRSCHTTNYVPQPAHGTHIPDTCKGADCNASTFDLDYSESTTVHHQLVRIKEPPESDGEDNHVDAHLTHDQAGVVNAGERVDISGVLKADIEDFTETAIPEFYVEGEAVHKHESDFDAIDTNAYIDEIKAIAEGERGSPYQMLIDSFADSLQGQDKLETIKLAIILQLFGGWRRPHGDGRYARGDMHIALIGDPATGKSSLLNAAESLSPRSTFVSGKNASKAGMTAAAVRDDFGETEWSLEAGAIVKAHKGVACVDEIDKVNPEVVSSLHTALEKQRLEVSKAGINATMKCETSLLAAGNPADGRFHDEVERIQQIDMAPALRSRFDLIYCLTDVVERERDIELAKHQTRIRAESGRAARKNQKTDREESVPIDTDLMRAYIAYAREHSHPIVESPEVEERIAETYADLRESDAGIAGLNARLVDAMNRISEASARVRLDDTVRMEDVERAESIINQYLQDIEVLDEHGDLNVEIADMMETGSSVDDRMEAKDIPGIIRTLQPDETSFVDVETVIQTADEAGYPKENTLGRIKNLADNGQAIFDERDNEVRML
jgi:replicative DNA helicase Mcm